MDNSTLRAEMLFILFEIKSNRKLYRSETSLRKHNFLKTCFAILSVKLQKAKF